MANTNIWKMAFMFYDLSFNLDVFIAKYRIRNILTVGEKSLFKRVVCISDNVGIGAE